MKKISSYLIIQSPFNSINASKIAVYSWHLDWIHISLISLIAELFSHWKWKKIISSSKTTELNSQFTTVSTSISIPQKSHTSIIMIFTPQALIPFTQDSKTIHVYPKLQDIEDEIERTFDGTLPSTLSMIPSKLIGSSTPLLVPLPVLQVISQHTSSSLNPMPNPRSKPYRRLESSPITVPMTSSSQKHSMPLVNFVNSQTYQLQLVDLQTSILPNSDALFISMTSPISSSKTEPFTTSHWKFVSVSFLDFMNMFNEWAMSWQKCTSWTPARWWG